MHRDDENLTEEEFYELQADGEIDEDAEYEDFITELDDEVDDELINIGAMRPMTRDVEPVEQTWIRIKGFRKYMINKEGVVRSRKTLRVIKPRKAVTGYYDIGLVADNGKAKRPYVHHLVFFSWNPDAKLKKKQVISHEDSNLDNFGLDNLKISSQVRNALIHQVARRKNGKTKRNS